MYILGLTTMGESAAALLRDGQVVALAEEERFSRQKHHIGFPYHAVRYVLREAGIGIDDIDHISHYWRPWVLGHRIAHTFGVALKGLEFFKARAQRGTKQVRGYYLPMFYMPLKVKRDFGGGRFKFHYVDHHVSHAASTFFASPFDEAAVLTVDGAGEATTVLFGHGRGTKLEVLREIKLPHSLGQFYSAATNYLGFDMFAGDEYKVMGMAGWGEPSMTDQLSKIVRVQGDGTFTLDITFLDHHLAKHHQYSDRALKLFGTPRGKEGEVVQRHYDIAASVQKTYEDTLFHMLRWLQKETGSRNLCMAGGCALNSLANGKIHLNTPFEKFYFQPSSHDAGGALGSALYVHHHQMGKPRRDEGIMRHAYWGPGFTETECRQAADAAGLQVTRYEDGELEKTVAAHIANGAIIAWFQGRMEWGPRALGHRSFVADPRRRDMQEVINRKIKLREPFRPFAPSMLAEASERYFGRKHDAPFMITVFPVLEERKKEIPAVVHVDGTARPQLVEKGVNPRYWQLIKEFENLTGIPVLLNTSFNVQEPIVCTPEDACRTFLATDVDYLVMENLVVTRKDQAPV